MNHLNIAYIHDGCAVFTDATIENTESSKSGNWSKEVKHEDDSDVLIECRNVYKSFGEKHILRGVSFKVIFFFCFYVFFYSRGTWGTI
ncbi:hypothetical protein ES288_A07G202000v1 [Gossypium darwinii]|uniref:Uncharacterized protein n=1 Tax=Gossypium darwinii TaxID=34276 RepID=A0A5D2FXJ3_GOSDA|nr:hypothetical protein ES288_A07G202000v1 [Gossypium darwinii]